MRHATPEHGGGGAGFVAPTRIGDDMTRHLAKLLAATTLAVGFFTASTARAADDLDTLDTLPPNYTTFVTVSFLYSFGVLDRDLEIRDVGFRATGAFEPDHSLGGSLEVGAFVSDRVRVSADLRISRTEFDGLSLAGQRGALRDVDADSIQAFVNVAYEVPLADLGLTASFLSRTSIFGVAGLGATNFDLSTDGGSDDDTAFTAKVGLGFSTQLTDAVSLVSQTDYIFGPDFEFEDDGTELEIGNEEIVSMVGLRFSF